MRAKIAVGTLVFLSIGIILTSVAWAADYPTKSIELLCPFTPGASMDLMARLVADIAPKYMGQPMMVVNKPGAGGSIAVAELINAQPDGYKLVTLTNMFFATTTKTQKVPFDPNDVVPIAAFLELRNALIVKGDSRWKSLNDLLDYGKKNPGQLKWAHSGRGISLHTCALVIFKRAGVETIDVPYKGSPESLAALLGGHVDAASVPYGTIRDHVAAGSVRLLTFYSDQRYSVQPNVPSCLELGFADAAKLATYIGVFMHKNTPESIKAYLINIAKQVYDDPRFKKGIEQIGEEPRFGGLEFVRESIKKGEEVGVPILKETGLYVGK